MYLYGNYLGEFPRIYKSCHCVDSDSIDMNTARIMICVIYSVNTSNV